MCLTKSVLAHSAFVAQSAQLSVTAQQQLQIPTKRLLRFWTLETGHIGNNGVDCSQASKDGESPSPLININII